MKLNNAGTAACSRLSVQYKSQYSECTQEKQKSDIVSQKNIFACFIQMVQLKYKHNMT